MKLFRSISNSSTMIQGYSYNHALFRAQPAWSRSLLSGVISVSLVGVGVYSGYSLVSADFGGDLGAHALNYKMGFGATLACLLGYSLRDLFSSITRDVRTQLRVARANSWLSKGTATAADQPTGISMTLASLNMVRFVEVDSGIKVFAIARHPDYTNPVLIRAMLIDEEYLAAAEVVATDADIRNVLNEACGEWSGAVAKLLKIQLSEGVTAVPMASSDRNSEPELVLDEDMLDGLDFGPGKSFGRASAPLPRRAGEALKAVAMNKPDTVAH
ncbi:MULTISPECIES: hypothetical protein [Pseudomonadaceae]|uniref:hypothetical protein n=1 Tax=Pseudomonadaceae TaxID=135621 RepID=UPI0015E2721F|nr:MULTISPECIES: hypothetical protein [Pseudomonadaceae]MBA1280558.1 hypothetical protein [Stutzerimonas stutzeri]MBH8610661.1 hypothetical protein [Pseudomonas mohnii]